MHLMQLQIRNFRNLREVDFEPVNGVNLITGKNASGKTSLLESIYYLSHVRSFRTPYVTDLIHRNSEQLQVFARIFTDSKNELPLGIRRSRKKLEVRANRQAVRRVADITTDVSVSSIVLAFSVSAIVGISFGYYPAKRAALLNPIEALRYE